MAADSTGSPPLLGCDKMPQGRVSILIYNSRLNFGWRVHVNFLTIKGA